MPPQGIHYCEGAMAEATPCQGQLEHAKQYLATHSYSLRHSPPAPPCPGLIVVLLLAET